MDFGETQREIFETSSNIRLQTRIWLPDKPIKAIFIGVHGGMAHAGDFITPALYFKEKGIATYAPDLRWHGTYPEYNENGKVFFHIDSYNQYAEDLHEFYLWVKERNPAIPIFILSHSNGSLITFYYGLTKGKNDDIRGVIVSSPWLKNKVRVPSVLAVLSKLIAKIYPEFEVTPESLTDVLTHDEEITARHHRDEKIGLRGTKVSACLAVESEKTQGWVVSNINKWNKIPVYAVVAGQDKLADPQISVDTLKTMPNNLCEITYYEDNYHENYNEVNREEIFTKMWDWVNKLL